MSSTDVLEDEAPARADLPMRRWLLAVTLLVLNLVDVVLTRLIIDRGGSEMNPVMSPIIENPGVAILLKTVVCLGVGILLIASPRTSRLADLGVFLVIVLYVIVAGWNLGILVQAAQVALG